MVTILIITTFILTQTGVQCSGWKLDQLSLPQQFTQRRSGQQFTRTADMMGRHGTVTRKLAETTSATCKKLLYTSLLHEGTLHFNKIQRACRKREVPGWSVSTHPSFRRANVIEENMFKKIAMPLSFKMSLEVAFVMESVGLSRNSSENFLFLRVFNNLSLLAEGWVRSSSSSESSSLILWTKYRILLIS